MYMCIELYMYIYIEIYIKKKSIYGYFTAFNLYMCVRIQLFCMTNEGFALALMSSFVKKLYSVTNDRITSTAIGKIFKG